MESASFPADKLAVRDFWEDQACGEIYGNGTELAERLDNQFATRYRLEPYISPFARFHEAAGRDVLEVGVGMGADHLRWALGRPRLLVGVDFTPRAVSWTAQRLTGAGIKPHLQLADAEHLPFSDRSFDIVYSWGVLHHTPRTGVAFSEVHRVLRNGGKARIMIYHRRSIVGYLLWARFALLTGHPGMSVRAVMSSHLESPGTQAFTVAEAQSLVRGFSRVDIRTQLSFADLLRGEAGNRHGRLLWAARRMWPRWLIRRVLPAHGLLMTVEAVK